MLKEGKNNSVVLSAVGYLYLPFRHTSLVIGQLYRESHVYAWREKARLNAAFYFRDSFLGKLILAAEGNNIDILSTSRFYPYLSGAQAKIKNYLLGRSRFLQAKYFLSREFDSLPIRTISLILIISIGINSLLLFIFRNTSSPASWIWRVILVAFGLVGLCADTNLKTLKENSLFIRIICKNK